MLSKNWWLMNKAMYILIFGFFFCSISAQNLNYCGTQGIDRDWEAYFKEHTDILVRSNGEDIYVPLTVHILGDDNGVGYHPLSLVFGSLETLNKDFAETGIKFFLGGPLNYVNESKWYEHEGFGAGAQMMIANNVANTINCYIVSEAAGNCGYRAYNGDAIALAKSCTQVDDHTWAHEMGHWLSLPHTFFGWESTDYDAEAPTPKNVGSTQVEKVDRSNCGTAADRICDTPTDYLSFRWGCDENNEYPDSLKDPDGVKFAVDGSLFMSYAFDACQNRFSTGQVDEMRTYLMNWVPEVVSKDNPMPAVVPEQTKLIYPINDEVVDGSVQLQWEENGDATFYVVEVSRFPNMGILSLRELVYGTSVDIFGLAAMKKYYWRVRPLNNYDFTYENKTEIESFETGELSSTDDYYAENLKVYPNPLSRNATLFIELASETSEQISIDITNLEGKRVYYREYFMRNGSNHLELDASSFPSGIYIIRGKGELHNFQKKIVIE